MAAIENIRERLINFIKAGGKIEDLKSGDPVYEYVKDARVYVDGQKQNTEQKFLLAGYPRPSKQRSNLEEDIKKEIENYRNNGGDFNVDYKDLPFYPLVLQYINHRPHLNLTTEQCLRQFGAKEVSKIYKRYHKIMDVKNYVNANGYADSYRRDAKFCNYISKASKSLDMLDSVVVALIGNQDVKSSYIDVDYIKYVKNKLENHLEAYEYNEELSDFKNLSKVDRQLYSELSYLSKNMPTYDSEDATNVDILYMLDIDKDVNLDDATNFRKKSDSDSNKKLQASLNYRFIKLMEHYKALAQEKNGELKREDIRDGDYSIIKQKSNRLGMYVKEFFQVYDISYTDGINRERFAKHKVEQVPYIKAMRKDRDVLYNQYLKENQNDPNPIKFENYLNICVNVYEKYKNKILEKGYITVEENINQSGEKSLS